MTSLGAPLGLLALLNVLASTCQAMTPADPFVCHGGRDVPDKPPEQPAACHATVSCAEHRRVRTFT